MDFCGGFGEIDEVLFLFSELTICIEADDESFDEIAAFTETDEGIFLEISENGLKPSDRMSVIEASSRSSRIELPQPGMFNESCFGVLQRTSRTSTPLVCTDVQ